MPIRMRRGVVNIMAVAELGWFAGQVAWCSMKTRMFPTWFAWFGYVNVLLRTRA